MARTIILKGDTARPVTIKIADDADIPAGANVTVGYQSAVRRFTGVKAGETIGVVFSADETAAFALGTFPLRISIDMNGRRVTSSNATQMVECTDDVTKGGSAIYYVDGGGSIDNIATLGEKYTMAEIRAKINEILKALGSGAAAIAVAAFLALGGGVAQAAGVTSARLDELPNDTAVVTAVDLSGLASEAAIPTKASQVGVVLTNGVITIDGEAITPLTSESDPTTGVTNNVPYVRGKKVLTSESDPEWRAWTNRAIVALGLDAVASEGGAMALGLDAAASGGFSTALGYNSTASGDSATALGYKAYAPSNSLGLAYTPDTILLCSSNTTSGAGSTARSLRSYLDEKADVSAIPVISASDATFSTAVLGVDGVAKKYTNGGALDVPKDAAIFTADVAEGASLVVDNLPTDGAYVTDFVILVNAAADTQLGKITTTETVLFAGGNLYETGSIAAGYSLITFTHTGGYWIASLTALEAATTTQE